LSQQPGPTRLLAAAMQHRGGSGGGVAAVAKKLGEDVEEPVEKPRLNALERLWIPAVGSAWTFFIVYMLGMGLDKTLNGPKALCPYTDEDYPEWYWWINMNVLGGFIIIWLVLVMKIATVSNEGNYRTPLYVALNIVTMGTIATVLATLFNAGGVCIDVLGVATPAAIWGEWIACGPLLFFITLTIISKSALNRIDWIIIITFELCLITGFFIIPAQPYESGVFWLLVSCITYLPALYMPFYDPATDSTIIVVSENDKFKTMAERYAQRRNLSIWLTIVLPLYTVNYIVAWAGGYGPAETKVIFQILSVLTKGLFAAATMDIHLSLMMETEKALVEERRANEARRAFMKFIFHEVRTPLNSLTMGIDMIAASPNMDESDLESLEIMRNASNFMSRTLNGVLSMHKIEEGKFEIALEPIALDAMINNAASTFMGTIKSKDLILNVQCSQHLPPKVLADGLRLEHVVSNLVSNAIKFSPPGGKIVISAECLRRRPSEDGMS